MENSKLITILAQVDEGTMTPLEAHNKINKWLENKIKKEYERGYKDALLNSPC